MIYKKNQDISLTHHMSGHVDSTLLTVETTDHTLSS